ncbi:wax ester/triacylglycerol synthase family O-acyltransferase [Streptomyces aurantiacus]
MTSQSSDLLAPLDLAFWSIESAEHPMHLGALGVFAADSPSAAAHAADLLAARAAGVPGLRMRIRHVLLPPGGAARRPAPGFDPLDHVHLAPPAADFHAAAGALMERPLDRDRPPWEAHVLPAEDGTSFAVLFKFHHALADGLRALTLAAAVMDPTELPPAREPRSVAAAPWWRALDPRRLPGRVATTVRSTVTDVGQALDIGAAVARANWGARSCDALTSRATGSRRTAGVALDLDDVHRVRKTAGGTVNDVLIAVVAGALRRWLDERGDSSDGVAPRALVPVSRRRPRTAHPGGNRLSGYLVRLPVDDADPLARLRAVRAAMDRNKDAGPTRGAGAVALLADHVPPLGHRVGGPAVAGAARLLFDILVTSVPLPGLGLRLAGHPLTEVYPFAPLARGQALAVAVSTYRGRVHYGLVADAAAVPDLELLARCVRVELAALVAACEGTRRAAEDRSGLVPGARAT